MTETESRPKPPGSDSAMDPVTATPTTTSIIRCSLGSPEQEQKKVEKVEHNMQTLPAAIKIKPEVKSVNENQANNFGQLSSGSVHNPEYPTLRLRMGEETNPKPELAENEEQQQVTGRVPRQAVTQPRSLQSVSRCTSGDNDRRNCTIRFIEEQLNSSSLSKKEPPTDHRLTFDQWLIVKNKQEAQRHRQSRLDVHRVKQQQQQRREMCEKCFAEWLRSKQLVNMLQQQRAKMYPSGMGEAGARNRRSDHKQRSLDQWQQRKQQELDQRRQQQEQQKQDEKVLKRLRHQLSQLAWQRWLTQVSSRSRFSNNSMQQQQQKWLKKAPNRSHRNPTESFYMQVPLSSAQRALRQRLDRMDGLHILRRRK